MTDARLTRRCFTALAGAAALGAGSAGAPALSRGSPALETLAGRAFGSGWRVSLPAGAAGIAIRREIEAALEEVDREMSPWRPDSDVARFNRAPSGAYPMPAGALAVTRAALAVAEASGGAFDPTVGPLVARWGFGPIEGDAGPDWRALAPGEGVLSKSRDGVTLDLCGIAKGHALDRVALRLGVAGLRDFLIDVGGELLAAGEHPEGRPWRAGVEDPRPGSAGLVAALALAPGAVATSGTRWNGYGLGASGQRSTHIIAPARREPVAGALVSVSVLAPDAMTADAWATALMAAGEETGPALASRNGIAALFLLVRDGRLEERVTGGFDAWTI